MEIDYDEFKKLLKEKKVSNIFPDKESAKPFLDVLDLDIFDEYWDYIILFDDNTFVRTYVFGDIYGLEFEYFYHEKKAI